MRLLGQLSQDSRWGKAMYNDPEMAEQMATQALTSKGTWHPGDIGWSMLNEQLALLIDLQTDHMRMISSQPNRKVDRFPRPETEFSRALERVQQEKADANLQRVYDWVAEGQRRWREGHRPTLVPPYEEPE